MKFRVLIPLFLALLTPSVVVAQTAPVKIEPGKEYRLAADTDGANTTAFRLLLNGAQVGADIPVALESGVFTSPTQLTQALAPGTHTLVLVALNPDKQEQSDPLTFSVAFPFPTKPINLRLILTVSPGGAVSFQIESLEDLARLFADAKQ